MKLGLMMLKINKRTIVFLLVLSISIWWMLTHVKSNYYERVPVKFVECNFPCINATINGVKHPMLFDLGSRLEAQLYKETLDSLRKSQCGIETFRNILGTEFKTTKYRIPSIKIGSLVFKKPSAIELNKKKMEESILHGSKDEYKSPEILGRGLLKEKNILLDFKNSSIIITNDFGKLKKDGYDIKSFNSVPFILEPRGIVTEVDTDLGRLKLVLDTCGTFTVCDNDLYPKEKEKKIGYHGLPVLNSINFSMGNENFGPQGLIFIKMPVRDLHGILGIDFLQNHVVYIDFSKKVMSIRKY